ncbi:MAG: hypothetical protein ACK4Z6_03575 [Candidatus Methylomirabilales bacterium]
MEKTLTYSYDPASDEFNLNPGDVKQAILAEIGDEVYVKLDPGTKAILGLTILHFQERFRRAKKVKAIALPLLATFTFPPDFQKELAIPS